MPRPDARTVRPFTREDRELDGQNRELRDAFAHLYRRVEAGESRASRVMAPDNRTRLWWPLNELAEPTFHNEGADRHPSEMLVPLATCGPALGGLLWDTCARLYGADATRHASGGAGLTAGDTPVGTVSCWIKPGDAGAGVTRLVFGYLSSDFARATIYLGITAAGLPYVQVETPAGTRSTIAQSDCKMAVGQWRHLVGSYDGTSASIYVDGVGASTGFSFSPLLWGITPAPRWVLGTTTAQGYIGLIQDARFHDVPRPNGWAHDAWRRGMGRFGTEVRL